MNHSCVNDKNINHIVLLLFFVAICIRVVFLWDQYLTVDDLYTITVIRQKTFAEAWVSKILVEPHPPLFYILVYFWTELFTDAIPSLHGLSLVISCVALFFIYKDGKHILPRYAYLLYFSFSAIAPISLNNFLEIRPYCLYLPATMVSTLYFIALVRSENKNSTYMTTMYAISATVACLSHFYAMSLAFFQVFYLGFLAYKRKETVVDKKYFILAIPLVCSLVWLSIQVPEMKNNTLDNSWNYPTGLKYAAGYFGQIFGMPIARIGASLDPQGIDSIFSRPLDLLNLVSVGFPIVILAFIILLKHKKIIASFDMHNDDIRHCLIAALILSVVPFLVFFIIGKILPMVHWKYLRGYMPTVWMAIALLLGGTNNTARIAKSFVLCLIISCLLYIPGLFFIPRFQIGDALNSSVTLSKRMNIALVIPRLIEYEYFIEKHEGNTVTWKDINKNVDELPETFISVFGHCTPTENTAEPFACVQADQPVLQKYRIEEVWKFSRAGIYQFVRKQ